MSKHYHPVHAQVLAASPDKRKVDDLIREFLIESQDGVDRMEQCLTELENVHTTPGFWRRSSVPSTPSREQPDFLGFSRLEALSHAAENLLGLHRDGELHANAELICALLQLLDGLRAILQPIEATGGEGDASDDAEMIERLRTLAQPSQASEKKRGWKRQTKQEEPSAEKQEQLPQEEKSSPAKRKTAPPAEESASVPSGAAESTLRWISAC